MSNIEKRELLERFLKGDVAPDEEATVARLVEEDSHIQQIIEDELISSVGEIDPYKKEQPQRINQ